MYALWGCKFKGKEHVSPHLFSILLLNVSGHLDVHDDKGHTQGQQSSKTAEASVLATAELPYGFGPPALTF